MAPRACTCGSGDSELALRPRPDDANLLTDAEWQMHGGGIHAWTCRGLVLRPAHMHCWAVCRDCGWPISCCPGGGCRAGSLFISILVSRGVRCSSAYRSGGDSVPLLYVILLYAILLYITLLYLSLLYRLPYREQLTVETTSRLTSNSRKLPAIRPALLYRSSCRSSPSPPFSWACSSCRRHPLRAHLPLTMETSWF